MSRDAAATRRAEAGPRRDAGFDLPLAPELVATGAVDQRSARIWLRSERDEPLIARAQAEGSAASSVERAVQLERDPDADHTGAFVLDGLQPGTAYRYEVRGAGGAPLGGGRFETAPEGRAPERFSIALASCNLPFDADGRVSEPALDMLRAAREAIRASGAKRMLWMGDQMYTDLPEERSLFDEGFFRRVGPPGRARLRDCGATEVRRVMQRRYHAFWSVDALRELHALVPGYPTWDDHEIVDNWGSDPLHAEPDWRAVGEGARLAYHDYQLSRVLPREALERDALDYDIDYGDVAIRVLDLRSNRTGGPAGCIVSRGQLEALGAFLESRRERSVVMLVLSVPLVHLPRWFARFGARLLRFHEDFADRWSSAGDLRDRDALLRILFRHRRSNPAQKIVLLSGDIHIGCAHTLRWREGGSAFHQLVSSPLTNRESGAARRASALLMKLNRSIVTSDGQHADIERLAAASGHNPYLDMNLGLLELRDAPDGGRELRYRLYGQQRGAPVVGYESVWF